MRAFALSLLVLAACGRLGASPTPLPTVVLDVGGSEAASPAEASGGITASGRVISPAESRLAFGQGGIVADAAIAVGDTVRSGDLLIELENDAVQLEVDRAERGLRELTSPAALAAADQAVALAQQEQDTAQKKVNALSYPRATEAMIDNLQAQITLARRELAEATDNFNNLRDRPKTDPERAQAQVRMSQAQINLNKLIGNYNWYTGQPSEIDVALAYANLAAATAAVDEARWYAAALRGDPIPPDATGPRLAALEEARAALQSARARLDATRLTSPVDGTVGAVLIREGEFAAPGQTVVIVTDLDALQVETTDLSELDLPAIQPDQPATVDIEALGTQAAAHVVAVSPIAQTLGGDVVYTVYLALDEIPPGLHPGMTVTVRFATPP